MFTLIARRLLQAIPTLLIITVATFVLLRIAPGGPFDQERQVSDEIKEAQAAHYGLGEPVYKQLGTYIWNAMQGDLGPTYKYPGWTVDEIIMQHFPTSLELGFHGLLVAIVIGMPIGVLAAIRHNEPTESWLMGFAMLGICVPSFVLGPLLLLIFASALGWFNPLGWTYAADRVLPAVTIGLFYAAYIARLSRSGMLDVMRHDYIRTARAKGLKESMVICRHALRTAMYPVVAYLGPAVAGLISGSFIAETIFFIPGLGRFFVNSAFNRDYSMVMGTVLFYAVLIILFNLLVDIIQLWMNPRTRND